MAILMKTMHHHPCDPSSKKKNGESSNDSGSFGGAKPRKGSNKIRGVGMKKQPQRGLGVAQLEQLRMLEQQKQRQEMMMMGCYYNNSVPTLWNSSANPQRNDGVNSWAAAYSSSSSSFNETATLPTSRFLEEKCVSSSLSDSDSSRSVSELTLRVLPEEPTNLKAGNSAFPSIDSSSSSSASLNKALHPPPPFSAPFLVGREFQDGVREAGGGTYKELSSFQSHAVSIPPSNMPMKNGRYEEDKYSYQKFIPCQRIDQGKRLFDNGQELTTGITFQKQEETDLLELRLSSNFTAKADKGKAVAKESCQKGIYRDQHSQNVLNYGFSFPSRVLENSQKEEEEDLQLSLRLSLSL